MEDSHYDLIKKWFLTKGSIPTIDNLYRQSDNTKEFLSVGTHSYEMPDSLDLKNILENWIDDSREIIEKAIFLDTHYAICPLNIKDNIINFIATYRE